MSALPPTGTAAHTQLTERKRQWRPTLREDIRIAWSAIDETRGIRRDQLDGMEEVLNWLFRAARAEGTPGRPATTIKRSVPQIVGPGGLNWQKMRTMRATQQRYRNQIHRRLEYAQRIGWVESVDPVIKPNGEGEGILIRLTPAGVAQSVAAALPRLRDRGASRTARRGACGSSLRGQVSAPLRESGVCGDPSDLYLGTVNALARVTGDATLRPGLVEPSAAPGRPRCTAPTGTGALVALLLALWRAAWPDRPALLPSKRRLQLERAGMVLRRLGRDPDLELRQLVDADVAAADPPRSASAYVLILRHDARQARRQARQAPPARAWTALPGKERLW